MAEQSGFFDAHLVDGEYDRVYLSEHFARYFASFIGNGIFGGKSSELMVRERGTPSMGIKVLPGQAWIDGYWYENTDELLLAVDIADGVLHRIDSIVVRWNHSERIIRLAVKKGTAATNPVAPVLQRDDDYYELKLADIYIKAGATYITQANITDKRYDTSVCGLVIGVVQQLDAEEFGIQLDAYIQDFIAAHNIWKTAAESTFTAWVNSFKTTATTWYNQFVIDSETAVNQLISAKTVEVNNLIATSQAKFDKLDADSKSWFSNLKTTTESSVNQMLTKGQSDIDAVKTAGQQNLAKVASDGQAAIDSVVTTGRQDVAKVVSDGTNNIGVVVTKGQQDIAKVASDGTTSINAVVTKGQNDIAKVVSDGTANINKLISDKEAEVDALIEESQQRFDTAIDELERIAQENDIASVITDVSTLKSDNTTLKSDVSSLKTKVSNLETDNTNTKKNVQTLTSDMNAAKQDIETLKVKVEEPNGMGIEDVTEKGCYYVQATDGSKEWINPPNRPGIEYKTIERWNGQPVYTQMLYLGALSNKLAMAVTIDVEYDKVFFVSGYAFDPENNMSYPFPIIINGLTPIAVISGIEGNGSESNIIINVNEDLSAFSGYINIKYIK